MCRSFQVSNLSSHSSFYWFCKPYGPSFLFKSRAHYGSTHVSDQGGTDGAPQVGPEVLIGIALHLVVLLHLVASIVPGGLGGIVGNPETPGVDSDRERTIWRINICECTNHLSRIFWVVVGPCSRFHVNASRNK